MSERVVENLNRALKGAMAADDHVYFVGEDVLDPYGGAFKVSRGLSSSFPDRVFSTPISEAGIMGLAGGLALAGQKAIVELMFGDFIFLAFDQIINFASKSVTMYGERLPYHLLIRCPVGGNRGYGATHSQSVQKYFIGIPNLSLYELSPLHDNSVWLPRLLNNGQPCVLFENKILYTQTQLGAGAIDDLFQCDFLDAAGLVARVCIEPEPAGKVLILTTGGMFHACLKAARQLFFESEIETQIIVPLQLYPFRVEILRDCLPHYAAIYVVEEGTAGGTWGAEVAATIHKFFGGNFRPFIHLIHSLDSIIPSARHLESEVLVQPETIVRAISERAS